MNTTIELTASLIERIYRLNLKFVHELWQQVDDYNYPEFIRCYYCVLNKKWKEYQELN